MSNLKSATERYVRLFGREPAMSGAARSLFKLDNTALALTTASTADEGIAYLAFATDDLAKTRHKLGRRGVESSESEGNSGLDSGLDSGRETVLSDSATHGVRILLTNTLSGASSSAMSNAMSSDAGISGLDHVVITTSHPERAAALYGARLGLEMMLDRAHPDWGSRLMFFKCGDLIVEIAHSLRKADPSAPDKAWGLSWRTPNIAAAHARLTTAGFTVSEVRTGRKPGTQVFTVRDAPGNVPTLVIGSASSSNGVN